MIEWSFEQGSVSTFPVRLLVYIRFLPARKEEKWFCSFVRVNHNEPINSCTYRVINLFAEMV